VFDGSSVVVGCPSSHPYLLDASVYGDRDTDLRTTDDQYAIAYDVLRDPTASSSPEHLDMDGSLT